MTQGLIIYINYGDAIPLVGLPKPSLWRAYVAEL